VGAGATIHGTVVLVVLTLIAHGLRCVQTLSTSRGARVKEPWLGPVQFQRRWGFGEVTDVIHFDFLASQRESIVDIPWVTGQWGLDVQGFVGLAFVDAVHTSFAGGVAHEGAGIVFFWAPVDTEVALLAVGGAGALLTATSARLARVVLWILEITHGTWLLISIRLDGTDLTSDLVAWEALLANGLGVIALLTVLVSTRLALVSRGRVAVVPESTLAECRGRCALLAAGQVVTFKTVGRAARAFGLFVIPEESLSAVGRLAGFVTGLTGSVDLEGVFTSQAVPARVVTLGAVFVFAMLTHVSGGVVPLAF